MAAVRELWHNPALRRAQLAWLLLAGGVALAVMLSSRLLPQAAVDLVLPLTLMLVSGAVVVAVTRYRLYDLDLLVGWTLLYAALAAFVVVLFIALVVLIVVFFLVGGLLVGFSFYLEKCA